VTVGLILFILAFPMIILVINKLTRPNIGFLRDQGFMAGPPGTLPAWLMALGVALGVIYFSVINVPPVSGGTRSYKGILKKTLTCQRI
jgi:hypothetical protein